MDVKFYNKIEFETIEIGTARDAVFFSFIAQKSITHLDLSVCEYTLTVKCVFTEEQCRKLMEPRRQLLYTLNLDLPKDLESSLRSVTPNADDQENYEAFYLGVIYICECVYNRNLGSGLIESILSATNKIEKLRRCLNVIRFLKLNECRSVTMSFVHKLILLLYPNCADSNLVVEFAITLKFCSWIFRMEIPQFIGFVLHHAIAIRFNIWQVSEYPVDPINGCILLHKPDNIVALLVFGTVLQFNHAIYLEALGKLIERRLMRRLFQKYIPQQRLFLILQLFYYHYAFNNRPGKGLLYIWRTIPNPYITEREIFSLFGNIISSGHLRDMIQYYKHHVAEETNQIQDAVPRCLQHLCRVVIRNTLISNYQLPFGINQLYIPRLLKNYLKLGC